MISGSYDPGEIYLFRGLGKGAFKARETICDKDKKPVVRVPKQKHPIESFGSWLAMTDWDDDGDLDIVLGGFDGSVWLRKNEGDKKRASFAVDNEVIVTATGEPMKVPGHHFTPVVADWNGDGRFDLLSGSENGGVYLWTNQGKKGAPAFGAADVLVPPHQGNGYNELVMPGKASPPGIRSQIFVVDYDLDGRLDLLLGDFRTTVTPRPDLKKEEIAWLMTLESDLAANEAKAAPLREKVQKEISEWARSKWKTTEDRLEDDAQQAIRDESDRRERAAGLTAIEEKSAALSKQKLAFLLKPEKQRFGDEDYSTCHGYLWLYLRKEPSGEMPR